jgi:hypothetical protein
MNKWHNSLFTFAVFLLVSWLSLLGCASSGFMLRSPTAQLYTPSNITVSEVYELLQTQAIPSSFSGKGKLFFSAPGQSERLSFEYIVGQDREVYELKNRIGIPVATIQIEGDSVLFLDRIESRAISWHKNAPPLSVPGLIPPMRV